jgi:hypothetical protein
VENLLQNAIDDPENPFTDNDLYDVFGQTMIHKAASLGHIDILMLLLERTGAKADLINA